MCNMQYELLGDMTGMARRSVMFLILLSTWENDWVVYARCMFLFLDFRRMADIILFLFVIELRASSHNHISSPAKNPSFILSNSSTALIFVWGNSRW